MNNEPGNIENTPAQWPLQGIDSNAELVQHTAQELSYIDVPHVYRGGEKTKDENEKAARQEVQRASLEHMVQMFNITEKSDSSDTEQMERMGKFYDFANESIFSGKIYLLEEIYQASKLNAHQLAMKFDEIFVPIYFKFRQLHGQKKRKEVEKAHKGKKIEQVAEETREDLGRIPYGPKGPSGTFGGFEERQHVGKKVQGGSPK